MTRFNWLGRLRRRVSGRRRNRAATGRDRLISDRIRSGPELLEPKLLLAADFGDAPDLGPGTGPGDYNTTEADNGPRHTLVIDPIAVLPTVYFGFLPQPVDTETDATPNATASGDDATLFDDEDGVNPVDLLLTAGVAPVVRMTVTNTSGATATVSGWIDYDKDGVFDNATERAQLSVPDLTILTEVSLPFPAVPNGFTGPTFARFRISTDAAAENPTGLASDGEVEDHVAGVPGFTVTESGGGTVVTEAGSTDTFTVVLDAPPASFDVTIEVTSGDIGEATALPLLLTFNQFNWNVPQTVTVTVTGQDDPIEDGDQTTAITLSVVDEISDDAFDPLANQTVIVTTIDDDGGGGGAEIDYGDAPDTAAGTGANNYNTLSTDNGPSHTIVLDGPVPNLHMGATVDGEVEAVPNATATGDDVTDDEDGPQGVLVSRTGVQPAIDVLVTNTSGSAATLYGWIDYNADGVFDNSTERTSTAVANNTNNGTVTLTFPSVPAGAAALTFARFRLSTDDAAANPTGSATDGEVEDHIFEIDKIDPLLNSFTRSDPLGTPTNADTVKFLATFSEVVSQVDAADFEVTGTTGSITSVTTTDGVAHVITVSGGNLAGFNGNVGLNLAAGQNIVDQAGNALQAGEPSTDDVHSLDNTAPGTAFTRLNPATSPTSVDTLVFRATFTEDVVNVNAADFAVSGTTTGTVTGVAQVSPSTYDVTVSGGNLAEFNGPVGLDKAAGQNIVDLAGNALPAGEPATDESYTVDNAAPVRTSVTRLTPTTSPTNADTVVYRVIFNEPVTNVDAADFDVIGSTASPTNVNAFNASSYDVTVSGGDLAGLNGPVILVLDVNENIIDLAGNALSPAPPGVDQDYIIDNDAPALNSILRENPASEATRADTLIFRVRFDEDVANVGAADFKVTGTTATITNVGSVTGSTYDVTVSGGNLDGLNAAVGIELDTAGQDITDLAGNVLPGTAPLITEAYVVDNTAPVLEQFFRSDPFSERTNVDSVVITGLFNEAVNAVATDFTVTGTTATITNIELFGPFVDITISGGDLASLNGTVGLNLSGSQSITDLAGNPLPDGEASFVNKLPNWH